MTLREIYTYAAIQVLEGIELSDRDISILLVKHGHVGVHLEWLTMPSRDHRGNFDDIIGVIKKHLGDDR